MNSEIIFLDSIKENSDISFEILERNQVLNSKILYEEVDVSFENCQEYSLHGARRVAVGAALSWQTNNIKILQVVMI